MQNLPDRLITNLAIQLKNADFVEEMQSIIIVYFHDHRIGFPRGQGGPLICLAAEEPQTYAAVAAAQPPEQATTANKTLADNDPKQEDGELDAVKGGKQSDGKGKGYGQCWHCGQMGHPRRECPEWLGAAKWHGERGGIKRRRVAK